jgi:hypothetical protein
LKSKILINFNGERKHTDGKPEAAEKLDPEEGRGPFPVSAAVRLQFWYCLHAEGHNTSVSRITILNTHNTDNTHIIMTMTERVATKRAKRD